jgi:hypothetical protein
VGVVCPLEEVRVDLQVMLGFRVAELTGDVEDVQAVGDQQRREAVAERVERQLSRPF